MSDDDGPTLFDPPQSEIREGIERDLKRELETRHDSAPMRPRDEELDARLREGIPGATEARFSGDDYDHEADAERLTGQILRVYAVMKDGHWRTLQEIEDATGDPQASISAQLRHLRKPRFGGYMVKKRSRGEREHGLFEYRMAP